MPSCGDCGSEIIEGSQVCMSCGVPVGPEQQRTLRGSETRTPGSRLSTVVYLVILLACVGLAISPYLPWVEVAQGSFSGLRRIGGEALALSAFGLAGIAISVISLVRKSDRFTWVLFLAGGCGVALSLLEYWRIGSPMFDANYHQHYDAAGVGACVCFISGVVILLGTTTVAVRRKRGIRPTRRPWLGWPGL